VFARTQSESYYDADGLPTLPVVLHELSVEVAIPHIKPGQALTASNTADLDRQNVAAARLKGLQRDLNINGLEYSNVINLFCGWKRISPYAGRS
jgi:hypothetical protein